MKMDIIQYIKVTDMDLNLDKESAVKKLNIPISYWIIIACVNNSNDIASVLLSNNTVLNLGPGASSN